MRGVQLNFTSTAGAVFNFNAPIGGFNTTVQNILVELGQKKNTDIIFTNKGNSLHDDSTAGGIVSPESLGVVLNELSGTISNFVNETEDDLNTERLSSLKLDVSVWEGDKARLNVVASSTEGNTVGVETDIV